MRALFERMLEHPLIYAAWQAPFVQQKFAPVERQLGRNPIRRVLDVGCGPGTNAARFDAAEYVGVDINEAYLAVARSKYRGRFVPADVSTDDLSVLGKFDTVLLNSFLHHLPDRSVSRVLEQVQLVLEPQGRVHILELVLPDRGSVSTLMAKLDRGRYARTVDAWQNLFAPHFTPLVVEPYRVGAGLWSMLYFQGGARV